MPIAARRPRPRQRFRPVIGVLVALTALAAGCGGSSTTTTAPAGPGSGSLVSVRVSVPAGNGGGAFSTGRRLAAPAGSTVEVWARVPNARFETWTPEGDLLVSVPGRGEVLRLHPGASRSTPPTTSTVVSGLSSPQGMAFDTLDGQRVLYVVERDALVRYVWNGTSVGARTTVVASLPGDGAYFHALKDVVVGTDHTVYLDVGSATNADPADRSKGEALIESFAPDGGHRAVLMTGVRNGDGLSFDPTGQLWTAVNNRDDIPYPGHGSFGGTANAFGKVIQSYVNNHPADEIARVIPGRDLGWPQCNPDQTLNPNRADPYGEMPLRDDAVTDADGSTDCARLRPLERGLRAHSAPLGFHFLEGTSVPARYRTGAVVATHGSNDHTPPYAAQLYWLPWEPVAKTLGPAQSLLTGFADSHGRWGKTVDAVVGPDGALYVSDDVAGAIYRLVLPSK